MTTLTARVTMIEQVVGRLITSRGPKVSVELRMARVRMLAGEPAVPVPPALHTVEELERQARGGTGVTAAMARSSLRLLRGPPPEGLLPPTGRRQAACTQLGWRSEGASDAGRQRHRRQVLATPVRQRQQLMQGGQLSVS